MPLEQFRNYCGPGKDRGEWFSLRENHETELRNCSTGCGPRHVKLPEFIQENRNNGVSISNGELAGEFHYRLRLPQVGRLLLKDSGGFQQKR